MSTSRTQAQRRTSQPLEIIAATTLALFASAAALAQDEAVATPENPAATPQLKEREHDDLGKHVAEYYEARSKGEGLYEAIEDIEKRIEAIEKRAKVENLLALTSDWEASLRVSKKYDGAPRGRGRVTEMEEEITGVFGDEISYWIHGPKGYRNNQPHALLVVVPDASQKLDELLRVDWVEKAMGIEEEVILVVPEMPENTEDWTTIGSPGRPGGVDRILQVIKKVTTDWNVDTERIFLCGQEDGVAAAFRVASLVPDRFAGVIGRSGDPLVEPLDNFANLPVLLVAGSVNATAMGHAAEERGWKHVETRASGEVSDIREWVLAQSRSAHPAEIRYRPQDLRMKDAYWLRVEGFDPEAEDAPWVHAVADRATNTITVDGSGVARVVLFFNDVVLDLDRPVKVVVGGVEHHQRVDRDINFMLERARVSGDYGRVYMTQKPFDFPVAASSSGAAGEDAKAGSR